MARPARSRTRRGRGGLSIVRDERGQVASWLIKLLVALAIVGFLAIEFGAVVINRLQTQDVADQTAAEAGIVYVDQRSEDAAADRAEEFAEDNNAKFIGLDVDTRRGEMLATVEKTAGTRVIQRIGALRGLVTARATGEAPLRS